MSSGSSEEDRNHARCFNREFSIRNRMFRLWEMEKQEQNNESPDVITEGGGFCPCSWENEGRTTHLSKPSILEQGPMDLGLSPLLRGQTPGLC